MISEQKIYYFKDEYRHQTVRATGIIAVICLAFLILLIWSKLAVLDEVTTGQGKVITWSRSQVIQSRDGGVIRELLVREGDLVTPGERLAVLDATRFEAGYNEVGSRVKALAVGVARLQAEIAATGEQPDYLALLRRYDGSDEEHSLSDESLLLQNKAIIDYEQSLLIQRKRSLDDALKGLSQSRSLAQNELNMIKPLVSRGAVSQVEELRLRRQVTELDNKLVETRNNWFSQAKEELVKKKNELDSLYYQLLQREDQLAGTVIFSPVKGIVKDVQVTTVGGVLEPGGKLMEVVPSEEQLLVEVKINPRDIAFIHPGQAATVKISAYESSIYGTMNAVVERISPDTIQDNVHRDQYYYQIYVRTDRAVLETKEGKLHDIVPGMVATVDITTGEKSVFDYLMKPLNKAQEALRER